jgi:feruloyl esterase
LVQTDFSWIQDAPTEITSAQIVAPQESIPELCEVRGYVNSNVGFLLLLPSSSWNGKFLMVGCGGFCGDAELHARRDCPAGLRRGYACISTDMGHQGLVGKWAHNNLQAEVDFGYRATHVTALAGKDVTQKFYGRAPTVSYYMGCSTGGRQGMVESQQFPWDFDGMVIGAPGINLTGVVRQMVWATIANHRNDGSLILEEADVRLLHESVLSSCDKDDDLADGFLSDPSGCSFAPSSLKCGTGGKTDCLSTEQIEAAANIYAGPLTSTGVPTYTGGAALGSELDWLAGRNGEHITMTDEYLYETFIADWFRYMFFYPDAGANWSLRDLNIDRDYKRMGMAEALLGGTNPDLRQFKASGGKMIIFQGLNDLQMQPKSIVDYYGLVERVIGGRDETQEFLRLFILPGVGHCSGGDGAYSVDYLSYIEDWVENGEAPDKLISERPSGDEIPEWLLPISNDPGQAKFRRPVFPYPHRAIYDGLGDPNDVKSFSRSTLD